MFDALVFDTFRYLVDEVGFLSSEYAGYLYLVYLGLV